MVDEIQPDNKNDSLPAVAFRPIGVSGLEQTDGIVNEEWLSDLSGDRWRKAIREMRDNSAVIGAILYAIENLILSVEWFVSPADDSEEARRLSDFVDSALDDMSMSWDDTLADIVTFIWYGWQLSEVVYKLRNGEDPAPAPDGTQPAKSKHEDGYIGWRSFSGRAQETLESWDLDDDGGIRGMYQLAPPLYKKTFIPIEKALLFRTTTRKNNPEGRSILRNAWRSWYFAKNMENLEGIGAERDLAGLPVAGVPPELLASDASAEEKAALAAIKKIVTNIRQDSQAGVVWPIAYDENGHQLYTLQLMTTGGARQFNTDVIIRRYEQRIAMSVLADFIMLGHDKAGSYSLASTKTGLFTVALGTFLKKITEVINTHAIPRLIAANGWDTKLSPKLGHGDIENIDINTLADYINKLAGAGMPVFPDTELENHLRRIVGLPEVTDEPDVMIDTAVDIPTDTTNIIEPEAAAAAERFNGAQISAVVNIARAVGEGVLEVENAINTVMILLGLDREAAASIFAGGN